VLPLSEPSVVPSVKVFTQKVSGQFTANGSCNITEGLNDTVRASLEKKFPNATVEIKSITPVCAGPLVRAAGDRIEFVFEVIFESTEPDTFISPEEFIDTIEQNTASIATDISNETGDEVSVTDFRVIENPSASPSLSPAPTLSQQPTLSNKPSYEFFPSSSPTQSSGPTSTPTKAEDRTFNIVSSFKFDDSRRQWCLQAEHARVNAKFIMRPCTDRRSKQRRSKQKFYLDEYDQLRLRDYPIYCMRWKKTSIYLGYCPVGIETSKANFTYEKDHQHFIVQKPKFKYLLGVSIDSKYEKVRLFKQGGNNINDSTKSWSLHLVQQK
jgi:hypothetical protein